MTYQASKLPPPPKTENPQEWHRWYYRVFELLNGIQSILADGIEITPSGDITGTNVQDAATQIITTLESHNTRHQDGGNDELNVAALSGLLAEPQTPIAHNTSHENGGDDEINVEGLSGELADLQPPKVAGSDSNVQYNNGGFIGGAANIRYDDVALTTRLGGASDYTEVEADGTVVFNGDAVVFNDINIPGNSLGIGPSAPAVVAIAGSGILSYAFIGTGVLEDELHGSMEILHNYKEGSDIAPHVHWMPSTSDAGNVKWQMEYIWVNRGGTAGASTTIDVTTAAGGTAWVGHISSFPAVSGAGMEMGSRFMFRIFRDPADVADTYGFDAVLLDIGVHYEVDTVGSRTVAAK